MERDAAFAALENARDERNHGWQAYKAQLAQMGWKLEKIVKTTLLSLVLFITLLCQYLTVRVLGKINHVTDGKWRLAVSLLYYMMSMYPLPMNPNKKGYRFPGRKMSAGAFQKLLVRISLQGIDVTKPIDLKEHWAKHGTNRYVTIRTSLSSLEIVFWSH
jgi:hypothetical protein